MQKNTFFILLFSLLTCIAAAQQNDCYESLLAKGKAAYNQKDNPTALIKWRAALDNCPDLTASQRQTLGEWIRKAENPDPTPPPVAADLVRVSGGTYRMGDVKGDNEQTDETPHNVTVSDFYISKYEVTFDEYDAFCTANGREKPSDQGWGKGQRPAINVDWYDAIEYCNWRSRKEGLPECYTVNKNTKDPGNQNTGDTKQWTITPNTSANGYCLPTEAEWEYAARERGRDVRFGNGRDVIDPSEVNFDANAKYKKSYSIAGLYRQKTVPVQELSANGLGLKHLSGNVWDWCWDWYGGDFYRQSDGARNPHGPASGSQRVVRGGSWYNNPATCRAANRYYWTPSGRYYLFGFRVVRHL